MRKTKSGQAATKGKPIKYEKEMEFLNRFLESESETLTNLSQRDSDEETLENISPPSTPVSQISSKSSASNRRKRNIQAVTSDQSTSTKALFQSYIEKKYEQHNNNSNNTVVDFFTNLGHTVKTLPEDLQIRVKGAVFKIVNDAESEMLQRKYSQSRPTTNDSPFLQRNYQVHSSQYQYSQQTNVRHEPQLTEQTLSRPRSQHSTRPHLIDNRKEPGFSSSEPYTNYHPGPTSPTAHLVEPTDETYNMSSMSSSPSASLNEFLVLPQHHRHE